MDCHLQELAVFTGNSIPFRGSLFSFLDDQLFRLLLILLVIRVKASLTSLLLRGFLCQNVTVTTDLTTTIRSTQYSLRIHSKQCVSTEQKSCGSPSDPFNPIQSRVSRGCLFHGPLISLVLNHFRDLDFLFEKKLHKNKWPLFFSEKLLSIESIVPDTTSTGKLRGEDWEEKIKRIKVRCKLRSKLWSKLTVIYTSFDQIRCLGTVVSPMNLLLFMLSLLFSRYLCRFFFLTTDLKWNLLPSVKTNGLFKWNDVKAIYFSPEEMTWWWKCIRPPVSSSPPLLHAYHLKITMVSLFLLLSLLQ